MDEIVCFFYCCDINKLGYDDAGCFLKNLDRFYKLLDENWGKESFFCHKLGEKFDSYLSPC